jgi:hypothetical protein
MNNGKTEFKKVLMTPPTRGTQYSKSSFNFKNPDAAHPASRLEISTKSRSEKTRRRPSGLTDGFFPNLPTSPFPGLDPAVGGACSRNRAGVVATDRHAG